MKNLKTKVVRHKYKLLISAAVLAASYISTSPDFSPKIKAISRVIFHVLTNLGM